MSNLKSYLAEKYMSGPKADAILAKTAPQKKKKRKAKDSAESSKGAMMMIDNDGGWGDAAQEEEDELVDAVVEKDRGFKKRKVANAAAAESNWITVEEGILKEAREGSLPPEEDDQPMVVDTDSTPAGAKRGGLMNPKDLQRILPQNNVIDAASTMTAEEIARAQETVYRDTSGKKIDTKAAKADAARLKREREEKEAQKMEWGKGLVQKDEAEKRREELEKQRTAKFARGVDDEEMNEDLKAKELWNDPAAAFITKKRSKGPRRPAYTGPPPPPNRFNIKPGYRWDGVDRSNGFEKKYFQSLNAKKRKGAESYQWSVDDM